MNINSVVKPVFELLFTFILATLFLVAARAIHSHWLKGYLVNEEPENFTRGKSEYNAPPRPHSKTFSNFFQLSLMSTPHRQRQLALLLSQLIKEQFSLKNNLKEVEISESLRLLLKDPNKWIDDQYNQISRSIRSERRYTSDYLRDEFYQILSEVERIIDIPLVFDME
ncbi:MAG: hypothetical protein EAX86_02460 [Candidatus Heimdallarchaeota archaeon]|nr:hypothetical protein [Candidatus Heimdallarchaeota archaeon]